VFDRPARELSPRSRSKVSRWVRRFPEDTIVQFNYLPMIHAQIAVSQREPRKAVEALQAASPYELGVLTALYPVYVRGEAYLAAHRGSEAAAEFQKIADHRGIVLNSPISALAHLGLARAYGLQATLSKQRPHIRIF
jgi:hypothetical protein